MEDFTTWYQNVGLKFLLIQGLSEPEIYGDLVYRFRKRVGRNSVVIKEPDRT